MEKYSSKSTMLSMLPMRRFKLAFVEAPKGYVHTVALQRVLGV